MSLSPGGTGTLPSPPKLGLTMSWWRICTCQAGMGSLGSQMGARGHREGLKAASPGQGLCSPPWHPCRMAPEGTVKWGQKEEGGMPVKKHSKFQASLLLPLPGSWERKGRFWEQVAEGGNPERAKNEDPQLLVAVEQSELPLFSSMVGG